MAEEQDRLVEELAVVESADEGRGCLPHRCSTEAMMAEEQDRLVDELAVVESADEGRGCLPHRC